ncbi:MAG TPA: hypothetical protein VJ982_12575 [Gemmatimonadota bacterium]|nr:hypothetical protein [Gemmatimonadota bacterium]
MERELTLRWLLPLALSVLFVAGVAGAQVPQEAVAPLPEPGPGAAGTAVAYLVDESRADAEFSAGRPITLQLWYPADASDRHMAPYLFEPDLGAMLLRIGYYGIDSLALREWARLSTHSRIDAPVASGTHPLLTLSVGLGVVRANYTSIAEALAARGYVVALVESPYMGAMSLPDGAEIVDTIGLVNEPSAHRAAVEAWSRDVSFALDRLQAGAVPDAVRPVADAIDWTRIGAFGHSTGGLVAIATCERDGRVRACANMDGGLASPDEEPLAEFVETGVGKPTLFLRSKPLYSDEDFARRGVTREEWEKRGEPGRRAFASFAARSPGPVCTAHVAGTGHFSFSDAPFVMPSAIARFGGQIIDARRGLLVITTVLHDFFEAVFEGGSGCEELDPPFAEVELTR